MFEGWLSDLLASYLGHFLDVKKEKLRVSLWSGKRPCFLFVLANCNAQRFDRSYLCRAKVNSRELSL